MRWYMVVLLVCLVIGPFEALHAWIRADRRRAKERPAGAVAGEARGSVEGYYAYATGVSVHVFFEDDAEVCRVSRAALPDMPVSIRAEGVDWVCDRSEPAGKLALMDRATGAWAASVERRADGVLVLRAGGETVEAHVGPEGVAYTRDGQAAGWLKRRLDPQRVRTLFGDPFPKRYEARCEGVAAPLRALMLCAPFIDGDLA